VLRRISKPLTCPACGAVAAEADYGPWRGLKLVSFDGRPLSPVSGGVQLRLAQQEEASSGGSPAARDRVETVKRGLGELIYDIHCPRGHSTLRTAPQITRALRRAQGPWARL
jgi:hypothetical protein